VMALSGMDPPCYVVGVAIALGRLFDWDAIKINRPAVHAGMGALVQRFRGFCRSVSFRGALNGYSGFWWRRFYR